MPPSPLALYAKWTIPTVSVPGGTFRRDATATNTSTVSAFRMARYEVTVDQILELGFTDTTNASSPELPFDDASWFFALAFCNRLSIREGRTPVYSIGGSTDPASWGSIPTGSSTTWDRVTADWSADGWRTPTEMEWSWAAMGASGGTTGYTKTFPGSTGSNAIGDYAWLGTNSGGVRHVVGTRLPNELGIYDRAGNAYERIWDREGDYDYVTGSVTDYRGPGGTSPQTRVYRGGSYQSASSWARLDVLGRSWQPEHYAYSGIRLVRRP